MSWQERLQVEYDELTERIANLLEFFDRNEFDDLEEEEKSLLLNQHTAMTEYRTILISRLYRLKG